MGNAVKQLLEFGPYRLDCDARLLLQDGKPVQLSPKAFDLLLVLVQRSGQVVLKDDLMKLLWPDSFVEESNLGQHVFQLRKALGDRSQGSFYIVTVPGRGYRFAAKVQALTEENQISVQTASRAEVVVETRSRGIVVVGIGVALLLGLAFGAMLVYRTRSGRQPGNQVRTALPATVKARPTLAVLGFRNLSGHSDVRWLSTAFSEMLHTELAAGGQVRVISSEEVAQMNASLPSDSATLSKETLARIRQNLGADLALLGTYSDVGKPHQRQIRLDLAIQDTSSGGTVATVTGSGTEAKVFEIASRVGEDLRHQLKLPELSEEQDAGVQASLPSSTEAERLYAEGLDKLRQFDALAARRLLEEAIASDSGFALAHSALAEVWSQLGYEEKAKSEAKMSLDLAGKLPRKDRLFIEARYRILNKEAEKAAEIYRTLFDFFPDDIEYGLRLTEALGDAGKRDDASHTIQLLRGLPSPIREDARIDLAEAANDIGIGQYKSARDATLRAITKARASEQTLLLARALCLDANALTLLGESEQAIAPAEEAKKIYAADGNQFGVATALARIGSAQWYQGEIEASETTFQQALAVNQKIGNQGAAGFDLDYIGSARANRGDLSAAKQTFERALAVHREVENRDHQGYTLLELAWVQHSEGDPTGAFKLDEQALAIFREITDEEGVAQSLDQEGNILITLGELDKARQVCQQVLDLARTGGNKVMMGRALHNLGNIAISNGALGDAQKVLSEAFSTNRDAAAETAINDEVALAEVDEELGRRDEAKRKIDDARSYLSKHKDPMDDISVEILLAEIYLKDGNTEQSNRAITAAKAGFRDVSTHWESGYMIGIAQGRLQTAMGQFAAAQESLQTVLAGASKHNYVRYELEARLAMCEMEAKTNPATARVHAKILERDATSKGFGLIAQKTTKIGT